MCTTYNAQHATYILLHVHLHAFTPGTGLCPPSWNGSDKLTMSDFEPTESRNEKRKTHMYHES